MYTKGTVPFVFRTRPQPQNPRRVLTPSMTAMTMTAMTVGVFICTQKVHKRNRPFCVLIFESPKKNRTFLSKNNIFFMFDGF